MRLNTAPMPVTTPQPTSAAEVSGTSSGIFTHCTSRTTVRSENTDAAAKLYDRLAVEREVGCRVAERRPGTTWAGHSHTASQNPHAARVAMITWSPGCHVGDRLADLGHDPGALVPAHGRERPRVEARA